MQPHSVSADSLGTANIYFLHFKKLQCHQCFKHRRNDFLLWVQMQSRYFQYSLLMRRTMLLQCGSTGTVRCCFGASIVGIAVVMGEEGGRRAEPGLECTEAILFIRYCMLLGSLWRGFRFGLLNYVHLSNNHASLTLVLTIHNNAMRCTKTTLPTATVNIL